MYETGLRKELAHYLTSQFFEGQCFISIHRCISKKKLPYFSQRKVYIISTFVVCSVTLFLVYGSEGTTKRNIELESSTKIYFTKREGKFEHCKHLNILKVSFLKKCVQEVIPKRMKWSLGVHCSGLFCNHHSKSSFHKLQDLTKWCENY